MSNELTALLPGGGKKRDGAAAPRLKRQSRFGSDVSEGVRPSRESINQFNEVFLGNVSRQNKSSFAGVAARKQRGSTARSFLQRPDGSISAMTPLEMGRDELYKNLPFVAVPGLQKKERNLSMAFSSFAASLDVTEADQFLLSTTGKGMGEEEKEKKARGMSMMLMDELESEKAVGATMPLVFAVFIASFLQFNVGYNISVMNPSEAYVILIKYHQRRRVYVLKLERLGYNLKMWLVNGGASTRQAHQVVQVIQNH